MPAEFDARLAGRSIAEAFAFLKSTYREINQLLETADELFGQVRPRWRSSDTYVTWMNSTALGNADAWIPRMFWRLYARDPQGKTWTRAAVIDIRVEEGRGASKEPWIGCYLVESDKKRGLLDWDGEWFLEVGAFDAALKWAPKLERRAFGWTEVNKKDPVKACGYFLRLTDIQRAEDLERLIVKPLLALDSKWDVSVLPEMPDWE